MRRATALLTPCALALLLAGCLSQSQLIERRIGERAAFFAALPEETRSRLRAGELCADDPRDAAWIVYGRPDRVFQKITSAATNEVWSYVSQEISYEERPRIVAFPVRTAKGNSLFFDTAWDSRTYYDNHEYLRIEFAGDRVLSIQTAAP